MKKIFFIILLAALSIGAFAQDRFEGKIEFSSTVHDFGSIPSDGGAVSCSFEARNISSEPLTILAVVSSCGCTKVDWTRKEIPSGGKAVIKATFENEDGPYPFDKTLSVHVSSLRKPVILHLRGEAVEKQLSISESYPVHFGALALRTAAIQAPNLSQGEKRSSEVAVANIGKSPITVTFEDVSEGLEIKMKDRTIAPGKVSSIVYTITADRSRWGKNWYYATPVVNGKKYSSSGRERRQEPVMGTGAIVIDDNPALAEGCGMIGFKAVTKESFADLSRQEISEGANPRFDQSSFSYGKVRAGKKVEAVFNFTNTGKKDFKIYKIDYESSKVSGPTGINAVAPGAKGSLVLTLDTTGLTRGEHTFLVNLYTSSPIRPIVTLYITGIVQ